MNIPLKVLVVEDSENDVELLNRYLIKSGYDVFFEQVVNEQKYISALNEKTWDIIIADYSLPSFTGIEALKIYKKFNLDIPFIILSGAIGEDIAVEAMKAGAHDYVMKANMKRLIPAINRELRETQMRKERRFVQEAFSESEAKYRILAQIAPVGIYMTNENGKYIYVNTCWSEMAGLTFEEALDDGWIKGIHPDFRKTIFDNWNAMIKTKNTWNAEYKFQNKNGVTTWVYGLAVPQFDENEKILRYIGINLDITERKHVEDILKKSLKEKEFFLQEINHRVNNNMQLISNLLRLQRKYIKDSKSIEIFSEIQNRIKTIALVHEKLYLTKGFSNINLKDYIADLVKNIYNSFFIQENKIEFNINVVDVTIGIERSITCGLIINELISNSLKYAFTENQNGIITILLRYKDKDVIELIYQDNGIGMPVNIHITSATTLGLRLIKILVEKQLDGSIFLTRDKGTKYNITFSKTDDDKQFMEET